MSKLPNKQPLVSKIEKDGVIIVDTRYEFNFILKLVKGEVESRQRCYTRAHTIAEAEKMVKAVANDMIRNKLFDTYDVERLAA